MQTCSRRRCVGREADRFGSRCSRRRRRVGARGSRGRRAGPAVLSRSGRLESGDEVWTSNSMESDRICGLGFFFSIYWYCK